MECNKEEAVRAKTIAERKMESKDFIGARKLALMAQRLCPGLEDVSQMITVCDIHCSAAVKTNGVEDWYGILQVEPFVDETTIKKQYIKLALSLHPDKNKFQGAEAAFKMVGEAHRVLSNSLRRSSYDVRRTSIKHGGPSQPASSFAKVPNQCSNNFRNSNIVQLNGLNHHQQSESKPAGKTFWTSCPYCHLKYRYYQSVVNKSLRCQYCMRPFIAFDMHAQNEVSGPAGMGTSCLNSPCNVGCPQSCGLLDQCNKGSNQQPNSGNASSRRGGDENMKKGKMVESCRLHSGDKNGHCGNLTDTNTKESSEIFWKDDAVKSAKVQLEEVNAQTTDSFEVPKRKWMADETVKSYHSHGRDGADAFSAAATAKNVQEIVSFKKQRMDATFVIDQNQVGSQKDMCGMSCQNRKRINEESRSEQAGVEKILRDEQNAWQDGLSGKGVNSMPDLKDSIVNLSVPDTDIYDFELQRNRSSFRVGQVWALYDDFDDMPRFYAEIKKVSSHGFKVLFTWLEYVPANKSEKLWYARKLPVACGNYKSGKAQKLKEIATFSHLMSSEKGARNSYKIHPRKGEIWAMYEDWDIRWWAFELENHESFSVEIVEIVSDNLTSNGVGIRLLSKVEGFVSVFTKSLNDVNGGELVYVPPNELLRFSHMIPSYKLTGKERDGIPKGSYELDTAALPAKFHSSVSSSHSNVANTSINPCAVHAAETKQNVSVENRTSLKNQREMPPGVKNRESQGNKEGALRKDFNHNSEVKQFGCENVKPGQNLRDETPSLQGLENSKDVMFMSDAMGVDSKMATHCLHAPKSFNLAGSKFHQFDRDKSFNEIQRGQVWALYSDLDGFPKYYALIKDVDMDSPKVDIVWLEPCPELLEEVRWFDKGLTFGCGRFVPLTGKDDWQTYDTLKTFSHQVNTQTSEEQTTYSIYPHVGDIWAMYKNWNAEWKRADFSNCEYQVVEIFAVKDHMIQVQFLDKVEGFFAVFTRRRGTKITVEIPLTNKLKFSHRIPSFLLTNEMGGRLRGSWELDPASLPQMLLCPTGQ